ncbi:MAG: hypothetical protein ACK4FG_03065 [Brevundimonas sp.]
MFFNEIANCTTVMTSNGRKRRASWAGHPAQQTAPGKNRRRRGKIRPWAAEAVVAYGPRIFFIF